MSIVPLGHGALWLQRGLALFGRAPAQWILVAISYWVLISLIGAVPYVGLAIGMLVAPAFSMSFMTICRDLERGRAVELPQLFSGFRSGLPALVSLGGAYLVALILVLALTQPFDGGALMRWLLFRQAPPDAVAVEDVGRAAMVGFALFVPVALAFWFAPPLVAWRGMSAPKALFFSFFAAARNWLAFLVYAGLLALGAVAVRVGVGLFSAALGAAGTSVVALAFIIVLLPVVYASIYASYRDVFPDDTDMSS